MISLSKGGDPAERNPNVGPIGETLSYVQRQVWVQEIAVWVQETASVAYGWVGGVMEVKSLLGVFLTFRDRPTDRPTYGPTDRPTE